MAATAFPCPHCSAPLRIRDRALLGREIGCPDCGKPILIRSDGPHGFAAVAVAELPTPEEAVDHAAGRLWKAVVASPAVLGCIVALGGTLGIWTLIDWSGEDKPRTGDATIADSRPADAIEQTVPVSRDDESEISEPDDEEQEEQVESASETELVRATAESSEVDVRTADSDDRAVDDALAAATNLPDSAGPSQVPVAAPLPVRATAARDEALTSGESGDSAALPPTADADLGPEPEDVPEPVNVEAALGQRIAGYRTVRPVVLRVLLGELEELVGVPIQPQGGNELDGALEQEVSVRLEATTVGEILNAVLQQAGLSYAQVEGGIRIRTAAEAGKGD